ncbi:MAG: ATP-binding cassette domain-containing protein, partial [Pseudolabrys sp.]
MLRIKGLTKRYRTGDLALKGIDIDVPDGQVMALIGPSGAGKSTVIRCVNRLVEPTSGSIELNGVDVGLRKAPQPALPEADIAEAAGENVFHHRESFHQRIFLENH